MLELRPYQATAIERVREAIRAGARRVLLVISTGGGKTFTAGKIIHNTVQNDNRVIFLAHRKELIQQCSDTLDDINVDHGVIKRDHPRRDRSKPVQVASVQTLINRDHWNAKLIVIDEAHRAVAKTYVTLIERYENPIVLGLSVGPKSICEFRGGPFGSGFVGPISRAYKIIMSHENTIKIHNLDVIDVSNLSVESRGWSGRSFQWKKVKTFIRHRCDRDVSLLAVGGDRILLTNDHSVYKVNNGKRINKGGRPKYEALIKSIKTSNLKNGDTLLLDDGNNWDLGQCESPFDLLSLNKKYLFTRVDFHKHLSKSDLGIWSKKYNPWKHGKHGAHLPANIYKKFEDQLPDPEYIYLMGSSSTYTDRFIYLSKWAYILGFYLGDGWCNENRLCFSVENNQVNPFIYMLEKHIPQLKPIVRDMPGACKEIRCSDAMIVAIFRSVTKNAKAFDKFIPGEWITSWDRKSRMMLLHGLIDSDGHISFRPGNKKRVYYSTTSLKLAKSLLSLLRSLGISGSIHIRKPSPGGAIRGRRIIGKRRSYQIHWSYNAMIKNNEKKCGIRTKFEHGNLDFIEVPIRKKGKPKTGRPNYVYDLEMHGHPSFVANGILVHNTATPYRRDGQPLGRKYDEHGNEVGFGFDAIVEVISTQELVDQGHLVNPTVFGCANPDISLLKVGAGGDYSPSSASKAVQKTIMHGEIISNWAKICGTATGAETIWGDVPINSNGDEIHGELFINEIPGKTRRKVLHTNCDACTVAFLPTVEDSKRLAEQFNAVGVPAAHLDANTPDQKREKILNDLRDRKIHVVTNVNLLTEGWDLPHLECIIGARMTRSKSLYKQMVGRLMRPDDDKRFAYVLDHANWTRTHGFVTDPCEHSLTGREKRPRKDGAPIPVKDCPQCGSSHPLMVRICEECGYEFPARETVFTDEDLVELNGKEISSISPVPIEIRQKAFNRYAARCVEEKRKPKQAEFLYFKEFGEWPTSETGIVAPRFFWQYKRDFQRKKSQQAAAQKAANQA